MLRTQDYASELDVASVLIHDSCTTEGEEEEEKARKRRDKESC